MGAVSRGIALGFRGNDQDPIGGELGQSLKIDNGQERTVIDENID